MKFTVMVRNRLTNPLVQLGMILLGFYIILCMPWCGRMHASAPPQADSAKRIAATVSVKSASTSRAVAQKGSQLDSPEPQPHSFLKVDEIETGDTGYGFTVFKGRTIERFDVVILGVLKKAFMGGDIILARLSGGPLEKTGIIAGMSGSPVYIKGQLIGAVAYGWYFAKEPICGITPIHEMLQILQQDEKEGPEPMEPPVGLGFRMPEKHSDGTSSSQDSASQSYSGLRLIETPVMFSGFSREVVQRAGRTLQQYGMTPMYSGTGLIDTVTAAGVQSPQNDDVSKDDGSKDNGSQTGEPGKTEESGLTVTSHPTAPFEPGAPLGVVMVSGDRRITGVGTLTYRRDDVVLAFGHSMFAAGPLDVPMTHASVETCLASVAASFKLATPGPVVGRVVNDRRPGIVGHVGESPASVSFVMKMVPDEDADVTYSVDVMRHDILTPMLLEWVLDDALGETGRQLGKLTLYSKLRFDVEGHGTLEFPETCAAQESPWFLASYILRPLEAVWVNPLEKVRITSVEADIRVSKKFRAAVIEEIRLGSPRAKPGDDVTVSVVLKPYRGRKIVRSLDINVPHSAVPGDIEVIACDAETAFEQERSRSPMLFEPTTLQGLIAMLELKEDNRNVVVALSVPTEGLMVGDRQMPRLPESVREVLAAAPSDGDVGPLVHHETWTVETGYMIEGSRTAILTIIPEESDF